MSSTELNPAKEHLELSQRPRGCTSRRPSERLASSRRFASAAESRWRWC